MTQHSTLQSTAPVLKRPNRIIHRTRGRRHGRAPDEPGRSRPVLKPFVFLDLVDADTTALSGSACIPTPASPPSRTCSRATCARRLRATGATARRSRMVQNAGGACTAAAGPVGASAGFSSGSRYPGPSWGRWKPLPAGGIARDGPAGFLLGAHGEAAAPEGAVRDNFWRCAEGGELAVPPSADHTVAFSSGPGAVTTRAHRGRRLAVFGQDTRYLSGGKRRRVRARLVSPSPTRPHAGYYSDTARQHWRPAATGRRDRNSWAARPPMSPARPAARAPPRSGQTWAARSGPPGRM